MNLRLPRIPQLENVPLAVLHDVIQPFPTFSEIYVDALKVLRANIKR